LQRLVSRLRKALPEGLVEGQTDGYRLTVEPDAVDAVRFERLVGQARDDGDPRRVRLLREALALWRGAAMQGVGLQIVPAGTSRSMPSSTILSPYAFRSPETAIAEVLMPPLSAPPLTRPCHAPDTTTDTACTALTRPSLLPRIEQTGTDTGSSCSGCRSRASRSRPVQRPRPSAGRSPTEPPTGGAGSLAAAAAPR
jgi:hypothetical protein